MAAGYQPPGWWVPPDRVNRDSMLGRFERLPRYVYVADHGAALAVKYGPRHQRRSKKIQLRYYRTRRTALIAANQALQDIIDSFEADGIDYDPPPAQ